MRRQQTIARPVRASGIGLFGGVDVTIEFCPAEPDHGIVFERVDLVSPVLIPAVIDHVVPKARCTVVESEAVSVSVIEHVMATLAGMQIDNCLIKIDAPEPPAGDGSSSIFVEALLKAGTVQQDSIRETVTVDSTIVVTENCQIGIAAQPAVDGEYEIGFLLDYGPGPIQVQSNRFAVTPETFQSDIAMCRTFVLEDEVKALQSQGIGVRASPQNVLVFGESGVIENSLQYEDECARHKILDCIGDFALLGCDLVGRFVATRSGHRLNHELIRKIRNRYVSKLRQPASRKSSMKVAM